MNESNTYERRCRGCDKPLVRSSGRSPGAEREAPSEFAKRQFCGPGCRTHAITDGPFRVAKRIHHTLWEMRYRSTLDNGAPSKIFGTASTEAKAREQLAMMRECWDELQLHFTNGDR